MRVLRAVRWIVEAMKLEYGFGHENHTSINNLSPSRIKQLLLQVVSKQPDANGMYVVSPVMLLHCLALSYALASTPPGMPGTHPQYFGWGGRQREYPPNIITYFRI